MPGQTVTIIQQVLNSDGYRADGYGDPVISRIIFPGFTLASGYPVPMNKLDVGLFSYSFILPTGATAIGTYIIDIYWYHPITLQLQQDVVLVVVNAPYGLYGATVGGVYT
jgi:peptidoglycan hydrolase-like protein with peptidoglycan-binding domain